MDNKYYEIKKKLVEYDQLHLLDYYEQLDGKQRGFLLNQIEKINFQTLKSAKEGHHAKQRGIIEPINALKMEEAEKQKEEFYNAGMELIQSGKVAAVLLAGGQGTRLGFDKPKGMLNIGVHKVLYLFEQLINNMMDVVNKAGAWIPLFIMTSEKNHKDTVDFFSEHNFFGYHKDYVTFFIQEMAPSVNYEGKIFLEDRWKVSMSPNGNGGWFSSLVKQSLLDKVHQMGIEWFNVFSVDNVLQKIADPYFVGATARSGFPVGSKVIKKAHPGEKVGVMCKEDGRPSIVEYYELTEEMLNMRDASGEPLYNYGVILNYLFRSKDLERILDHPLPLHIVQKKIPYIDQDGQHVYPKEPNGYKFETLVLDMIHMLDDCLVYEVEREKEFAPIKNKEGADSIDTARQLLITNGVKI